MTPCVIPAQAGIQKCRMGNLFAHEDLTAHSQFVEVQGHQVLKVGFQFILGETGEKFGLGGCVDFANAVD
jgi:hypothetical protein